MSSGRPRTAVEIVAPAGTPRKLETAIHFGADAVYLGLKDFSMRSRAGNFDLDQLEWALQWAHERGRRVFVAINVVAFDEDTEKLEQVLRDVAALGSDAIIVADPGVLRLAREYAPGVPLHLSTQANTTNASSARFWFEQGISRIVLARELSLEQLGGIARDVPGDLEVFAHGAVCVAYSGRCFMSLYWAGRDPRRGDCAQACRWPYRAVVDGRHPDAFNPVEEDERGTYFFDAKDLCTIPILDRLLGTGVRSLKIEGRTRSPLYVASVVDVYRDAVSRIEAGDLSGFRAREPTYLSELRRVTRRDFSTHFLTGEENAPETYTPTKQRLGGRADFLGRVVGNDGRSVLVEAQTPIRPGVTLELRDRGLLVETAALPQVRDSSGATLDFARTGDTVRVDGVFRATVGALVRVACCE